MLVKYSDHAHVLSVSKLFCVLCLLFLECSVRFNTLGWWEGRGGDELS